MTNRGRCDCIRFFSLHSRGTATLDHGITSHHLALTLGLADYCSRYTRRVINALLGAGLVSGLGVGWGRLCELLPWGGEAALLGAWGMPGEGGGYTRVLKDLEKTAASSLQSLAPVNSLDASRMRGKIRLHRLVFEIWSNHKPGRYTCTPLYLFTADSSTNHGLRCRTRCVDALPAFSSPAEDRSMGKSLSNGNHKVLGAA